MSKAEPTLRGLTSRTSLAVLGVGVVALGAVAVALGQDTNWDLRNYHLYNGYAALNGRLGHDIAPAQLQTYFNPTLYVPTYLLLTHVPPRVAAFVLGAIQGVNFWLIYLIARVVLSNFRGAARTGIALACAALGVFGAIGISELGTTFHDLTTSTFVLGAVLWFLGMRVEDAPYSWRALVRSVLPAGVILGAGVGLKYTLATYAVGFVAAVALTGNGWKRRSGELVASGTGMSLGILMTAGHWLYRLQRTFGSPLFPFYNAIFKSPYFDEQNFADDRFVPRTLAAALAMPFRFTVPTYFSMSLLFRDLRFAVVEALMVAAVIAWAVRRFIGRSRAREQRGIGRDAGDWLVVFFLVSYVLWVKQFSMYRYVATLEQLAPVVIVVLAGKVLRAERLVVGAVAALFAVIAGTVIAPDWGRLPWGARFLRIAVPPIARPDRSTVVITSSAPLAYLIPSFPPETRFVRIEGNFFAYGATAPSAARLTGATRKREPDGDYYLMTASESLADSDFPLSAYSLVVVANSCVQLALDVVEGVTFCRLERGTKATIGASHGETESFGSAAATAGIHGTLTAMPNPVAVCAETGLGMTTVSWRTMGTPEVEIHVGAPNGPLFARGGPAGSSATGDWVARGTTFYLQTVGKQAPLRAENTLARLTVDVVPGKPCP
jgi:hypothetical protein